MNKIITELRKIKFIDRFFNKLIYLDYLKERIDTLQFMDRAFGHLRDSVDKTVEQKLIEKFNSLKFFWMKSL